MNFRSKEFKKLQKQWYKKISKSGFQDIEQDENNLKVWSSQSNRFSYNQIAYEAKETYYRMASYFLNDYLFSSRLEKLIWELHSEGKSVRMIASIVKKRGYKAYKDSVHKVVVDLAKKMREKYKNEQN